MKKLFGVLGVIFVIMLGGCALTMCAVGEAVDEVTTEIVEESNTQEQAVEQITKDLEWTFVPDGYGYGTLETTITNNTDVEIDYIEFNAKFIKDGVTVSTDWTNAVDIAVGESRKIEFVLVEEGFDSFEITSTSNALE